MVKWIARLVLMIVALAFLAALSSCSNKLGKIRTQLAEHPEWLDSIKIIQHDTVKITSVKDSIQVKRVVDTTAVSELAKKLSEAKQADKPAIIEQIAEVVCPEVTKDVTYHIKAGNSEFSLLIPIHVKLKSKGEQLDYSIESPDIKLPETRVVTTVQIKTQPEKFYVDKFFWIAVVLFIACMGLIFRR